MLAFADAHLDIAWSSIQNGRDFVAGHPDAALGLPDLLSGGVTHTHRPAARVSDQFGDLRLGTEMFPVHRVQRSQTFRPGGVVQHAEHPVEEVNGLGGAAQLDER